MVSVEYMVSYSQILEILKYIPKEDYNKIPKNIIELFENNCYKESEFKYNPEKTLKEQNVTNTTQTIIAILFRDYWSTEEQRDKIKKVQDQERLKQVDVNDIFKGNKQKIETDNIEEYNVSEKLPIVVEKDNIFKRIINKIRRIFNK